METQAEESGDVDYLARMLDQVIESTQRLDIEKVQIIKKLVKDLLKAAYINDDYKTFAKIVEMAVNYAFFCQKKNLPQYMSSVFEIDYDEKQQNLFSPLKIR